MKEKQTDVQFQIKLDTMRGKLQEAGLGDWGTLRRREHTPVHLRVCVCVCCAVESHLSVWTGLCWTLSCFLQEQRQLECVSAELHYHNTISWCHTEHMVTV